MKKLLTVILALAMVLSLAACGGADKTTVAPEGTTKAADTTTKAADTVEPDKNYVIRIYSNSNSSERVTWLIQQAEKAGFKISLDTNEVVKGDTGAVQAADEKKDGDLIFGLNETRWGQLIGGTYANLKVLDWTPTWADKVGEGTRLLASSRSSRLGASGAAASPPVPAPVGPPSRLRRNPLGAAFASKPSAPDELGCSRPRPAGFRANKLLSDSAARGRPAGAAGCATIGAPGQRSGTSGPGEPSPGTVPPPLPPAAPQP